MKLHVRKGVMSMQATSAIAGFMPNFLCSR